MAYNMDINKGLYPDEEGYRGSLAGKFKEERAIEGTLTEKFKYIHPQDFHTKLMKSGTIQIMRSDHPTYTDIKIRNDIEMTENKPPKYFQPKLWNTEKLLFNYDALYHLTAMDIRWYQKYCKMLKITLRKTYLKYNVPKDDWAIQHWGMDEV